MLSLVILFDHICMELVYSDENILQFIGNDVDSRRVALLALAIPLTYPIHQFYPVPAPSLAKSLPVVISHGP